jgi:SM-20-related protein
MKHKPAGTQTFLNQQLLLRKLAQDPGDMNAMEILGHIFRKRGDFPSAASIYQRLSDLEPQHEKYGYLNRLLTHAPTHLACPPAMPWPAPFSVHDDFLSDHDAEEILQHAIHARDGYEPACLGGEKKYDPAVRAGLTIAPGLLGEKFREKVEQLLPAIVDRLMVPAFVLKRTELKLLAYASGHFFRAHADHRHCNRLISFSYCFHQRPKSFSGGDLLVYDTDVIRDVKAGHFTLIECIHNRLVLFPSSYYHEVTPLQMPDDDFDNCRFALSGHFQA